MLTEMRINLHNKIVFLFTLLFSLLLTGVFVLLSRNVRQFSEQRLYDHLTDSAALARTFLSRNAPVDFNISDMDQLTDKIGADLRTRVTVMDSSGRVLGDSFVETGELSAMDNHLRRPEIFQARGGDTGKSLRISRTTGEKMFYVALPLGGGAGGYIRLAVPEADLQRFNERFRRIWAYTFILAVLAAAGFGWLISKKLSRPIQEMLAMTRRIAAGDFSKTLNIRTNDEIEDLSVSINTMGGQIKARINELISSRSRLEAVFLSMFEGVMIVDTHGSIILMNQTLRNLLRVGNNPVAMRPLEVIRNLEIQEICDRALNLQSGVVSKELTVLLPEERILLAHGTPVIRDDRVDGAVLVFHDITDLRRLEHVRKDFVANVSHELRTPVSTIKGYAETLLDGAIEDKENARDFLRIIYEDADRLAKLINDLLDLSRIESGKLKLRLAAQPLSVIVRRVARELEQIAVHHGAEIRMDIPDNLPAVLADENGLAQVFLNLLENGLKYNKPGGYVEVSARVEEQRVRIQVKDTGIGIPEEDIPRVFERFYRVDKAHSRQMGGTGLGLAIVKHLIQSHGGDIELRSVQGEGSVFSFTLPAAG